MADHVYSKDDLKKVLPDFVYRTLANRETITGVIIDSEGQPRNFSLTPVDGPSPDINMDDCVPATDIGAPVPAKSS